MGSNGNGARSYFRCEPLDATISLEQCRGNRARLSVAEAAGLPYELPPWRIRPLACSSCALACRAEAGAVPLYTAEDVLSGRVPRNGVTMPC